MNGKQRAKWLAKIVSDLQKYLSSNGERPETSKVIKAIGLIEESRSQLQSKNDNEIVPIDEALRSKLSEGR